MLLLLSLCPGCYLSHQLEDADGGVDAGRDARVTDALSDVKRSPPLPRDAGRDSGFVTGPDGCKDYGEPAPRCDEPGPCPGDSECVSGVCCVGPYHARSPDGRCVWSCSRGTRPCVYECVCRSGFVETGTDSIGRRVCEPRGP